MCPLRLGLLGNPVAHSRSPEIQHALIELAGLTGAYTKILADEQTFARVIEEIRAGEWDGLNVTMPHKALAASACDEISDMARTSRSVNTLHVDAGRLIGESTDTTAMAWLLAQDRFEDTAPILVLGSGGGAAAVLAGLGHRDFCVSARRPEAARELADRFAGRTVGWGSSLAGAVVVNSTPIGMAGEELPTGVLEVSSGLVDLAYSRVDTPAVATARRLGIPVVDGYEFLVRQAIDSFAIWTGVRVPFGKVIERLRNT